MKANKFGRSSEALGRADLFAAVGKSPSTLPTIPVLTKFQDCRRFSHRLDSTFHQWPREKITALLPVKDGMDDLDGIALPETVPEEVVLKEALEFIQGVIDNRTDPSIKERIQLPAATGESGSNQENRGRAFTARRGRAGSIRLECTNIVGAKEGRQLEIRY